MFEAKNGTVKLTHVPTITRSNSNCLRRTFSFSSARSRLGLRDAPAAKLLAPAVEGSLGDAVLVIQRADRLIATLGLLQDADDLLL